MKRLALFCAAVLAGVYFAPLASAGENKYLGSILSDGGLSGQTNATTATPFVIPPLAKLTVYCNSSTTSYVLSDNTTVSDGGTTKGLPVAALQPFPTSVGQRMAIINATTLPDAGTTNPTPSALLAVFGTGTCDVFARDGHE